MSKKIIIIFLICINTFYNVYGINTKEISNDLQLEEIIMELRDYTENLDLDKISKDLLNGDGIKITNVKKGIIDSLKSSILPNVKNIILVLIFLVLLAIIKSLELEKDSSISKTANIVGMLIIITVFLSSYSEVLSLMKKTVELEIGVVQIISPFLMGMLVLTGAITTTSLLEPIILLLVSTMGFCVNHIILPLITISVVLNIVSNISDTINLKGFSNISNKTALWINGIFLTTFLAIVGLQTTVSTSIDSVTIKTTQAAVSGVVPVVRQICVR